MAGEHAAHHLPERPQTWRRWDDIAPLFDGPADPSWDTDRDAIESDPPDD